MPHKIFFSWQSDTPNDCGRTFLERALKRAIELLGADAVIDDAIRNEGFALDSDTKGEPGTPPIAETIFKKIDAAAIFVADVTFVASRPVTTKRSPNPNVLIEYGWALNSLKFGRVLTVMNTAYGEPTAESLPFDMRHSTWPIRYHLSTGADVDAKRKEVERLARVFKKEIKLVLDSDKFKESLPKPVQIAKFEVRQPRNGQARFRAAGAELGLLDDSLQAFLGNGSAATVTLGDGPAVWLRMMPEFSQEKTWPVKTLKSHATHQGRMLLPLGWSSFQGNNYVRAEDGFGFASSWPAEPSFTPATAFAFITGELWSINAFALSRGPQIPYVELLFAECFQNFLSFLKTGLQIRPPYRWIAGLEGVKGFALAVPYAHNALGRCVSEIIQAEGTYSDGDEIYRTLVPFFELIYDRCGLDRSPQLDEPLKRFLGLP
jgi:hypothetical protein